MYYFIAQLLLLALPACVDSVAYKVIWLGCEEIFDQDTFGMGKERRAKISLIGFEATRLLFWTKCYRSETCEAAMTVRT